VLPESVTGQMSLRKEEKILDQFYGDSPVTYSLFNDPDEGMNWLEAHVVRLHIPSGLWLTDPPQVGAQS
jgi:hypothetical protein